MHPGRKPVGEASATDVACFLPVEIVDRPGNDDTPPATDPAPAAGAIEIDIAGGRRLRISGAHDPDALARLIRAMGGTVEARAWSRSVWRKAASSGGRRKRAISP